MSVEMDEELCSLIAEEELVLSDDLPEADDTSLLNQSLNDSFSSHTYPPQYPASLTPLDSKIEASQYMKTLVPLTHKELEDRIEIMKQQQDQLIVQEEYIREYASTLGVFVPNPSYT